MNTERELVKASAMNVGHIYARMLRNMADQEWAKKVDGRSALLSAAESLENAIEEHTL
jgi:hypothetical protein